MKDMWCSRGTAGNWAPALGQLQYSSPLWGKFYVVLGAIQRVKVRDKVMSYIMLFCSGQGYYRGNIRLLWKYPRSMDMIRISWIHLNSVDIIRISRIYPRSVDIIRILWILSALCGYYRSWPHYELSISQWLSCSSQFCSGREYCYRLHYKLLSTYLVMSILYLAF